jgi:hypothetical protein
MLLTIVIVVDSMDVLRISALGECFAVVELPQIKEPFNDEPV